MIKTNNKNKNEHYAHKLFKFRAPVEKLPCRGRINNGVYYNFKHLFKKKKILMHFPQF